MLSFNSYQNKSRKHAFYPNQNTPNAYRYLVYGITGEAGELAEHFKHSLRDENDILTPERRDKIVKELGDLLWYITNLGIELGVNLEDIAKGNLDKIDSRLEKGTLKGEGDSR